MKYLLICYLFTLTSCASYVQSLHNQIDRETYANQMAKQRRYNRQYGQYRGSSRARGDRRPILNPITIGNAPQRISTVTTRNLPPENADGYGKKRVTAEDLKDNDESGSLWSGKSGDSFLFVTNNVKRHGDIVIIEVLKNFKNKITSELKTAFPQRKQSIKKTAASTQKVNDKAAPEKVETEAAANDDKDTSKVYDKISTSVIEEVNQDYLLIRGRKEVLYQKAKRFIEVQALVSRRDISDNDAVKSNKMLEPKITVLRY